MVPSQQSTPRSLPAGTIVSLSCGALVKLMHATLIEELQVSKINRDSKIPSADGNDKGEH